MKQHCKESSSFCSQEFPEYVKKLTLTEKALTAQRPNSELSAGTPSELSRPITNHYKYRSQLSSAAGGRGHHRPSTSQNQSRSGHLPSFNEIKKTLREQILKKHHSELNCLQQRLNAICAKTVNQNVNFLPIQPHSELVSHLQRNSKLELVSPFQPLGKDSFHVECLDQPLNDRAETVNEQLQFEVPTSFQFYINNKKKALYQQDNEEKENMLDDIDTGRKKRSPIIDKPNNSITIRRQPSSKRRPQRYDAWYMPRKYWSRVKETTNRTSTLQRLRTDPKYLYKTLYDGGSEFPFQPECQKDKAYLQQLETFNRNREQLQKNSDALKEFQTSLLNSGKKPWILQYRVFADPN